MQINTGCPLFSCPPVQEVEGPTSRLSSFNDVGFQREAGGSRWETDTFCSSNDKNSRPPPAAQGTAASVALKCNKVLLQVSHSAKCVKIPDERRRERERERPSFCCSCADASRHRLCPPQANVGGCGKLPRWCKLNVQMCC